MAIRSYLLAGLGSFIGGILRFAISYAYTTRFNTIFPYHTFLINILGSLVIGIIAAAVLKGAIAEEWRIFLAVGVCGGFTTFSAFSLEMLDLIRAGSIVTAIVYAAASVLFGLLAAFLGFYLFK